MSPLQRRGQEWIYTPPRPPGWGPVRWAAVRAVDRVFHTLAYGRLRVPGLAALEHHQPLRGWCDAVTGISPAMRVRIEEDM